MTFVNRWADTVERDGVTLRRVAWWNDLCAYYRAPDGVVWAYHATGRATNCGHLTAEQFRKSLRGKWEADGVQS